jgi:hypothetical protein
MSALFTIDQTSKPAGILGRAREDIDIGVITVDCPDTHSTYLWEFVSYPVGIPPVIDYPTVQSTTITLSERGGYILRLTVDDGLPTEDISIPYIGIALEKSGLCIPALDETINDNSQSPYDGRRGAEEKLTAFYKWLDTRMGAAEIVTITRSIATGASATGYLEIGFNEGMVYYLSGVVSVSTTDDANIELADGDFSGSPNVLYEIGYEDGGDPLWNPDEDGNWIDRNAFGIFGLTDGKLYYRLTNAGPNTISITLEVRIIGVS